MRYVGNYVACLLNHVLRRAFGDAYMRRENVRHATLLFCAESVNVRTIGAGEVDDE